MRSATRSGKPNFILRISEKWRLQTSRMQSASRMKEAMLDWPTFMAHYILCQNCALDVG